MANDIGPDSMLRHFWPMLEALSVPRPPLWSSALFKVAKPNSFNIATPPLLPWFIVHSFSR